MHLSFNAKTNQICYASGKSIIIRSLTDTAKAIQFNGHNSPTTVAKFSPSGNYVASGDESGLVKVWDCVTEELILKNEIQVISGRINDLSWDVDSARIVAVGNGNDKYGHCFTWDTGNSIGEISGHSAQINAVAIRPVRPYRAATVSDDSGLVFLQGPPFKFAKSVRGHHSNFVRDVAFSHNGEYLVSVGFDRKVVLYEGKTGDFVKVLDPFHQGGVYGCAFSTDNHLFTASADGQVAKWDLESGSVVHHWSVEKSVDTQMVGVVHTGEFVVSLALCGDLYFWAENSSEPVKVVSGHQKSIIALATDGETVFSGSYDGQLRQWTSDGVARKLSGHSNLVVGIQTENGLVSTGWDDTLKLQSEHPDTDTSQPHTVALGNQPRGISGNSQTCAVLFENCLALYHKDVLIHQLSLSSKGTCVALSEKYLIVGVDSKQVTVYSSDGKTVKGTLSQTISSPCCVSISPNEEYAAVGDSMGKVVVYTLSDLQTKTSRWAFNTSRIQSISWNQDSDRCAVASLDTNIIVYSVSKPSRNVKAPNAHKDGVNAVKWLDSDTLISGGNDGCIKKWELVI